MNKVDTLRNLSLQYGTTYSDKFHIKLPDEVFKWFFLATLFGARISKDIALRTYKMFEITMF